MHGSCVRVLLALAFAHTIFSPSIELRAALPSNASVAEYGRATGLDWKARFVGGVQLPATIAPGDTPPAREAVVHGGPAGIAAYDAFYGLTPTEIESFLREAPVVRVRDIGVGVTRPLRATLDNGRMRHDAAVQSVDVCEEVAAPDVPTPEVACDSYRYNIAAYEIGKLLGLENIPVSVERVFNGRPTAFTWWIDRAVTLAEMEVRGVWQPDMAKWDREHSAVRIFDELIFNTDRHMANLLQDPVWWIWMIDHSKAFRPEARLRNAELLGELPADSVLLAGLRRLGKDALERCCARYLSVREREAVLARRDSIVVLYSRGSARSASESPSW